MSDDIPLTDSLNEEDKRYLEELKSMSESEMLDHMRKMRDELRANGGKLASERGLSDEYLETIDSSITKLEEAILQEQMADERLADAARKMNAAADTYLHALDDQAEFPQIIGDRHENGKE